MMGMGISWAWIERTRFFTWIDRNAKPSMVSAVLVAGMHTLVQLEPDRRGDDDDVGQWVLQWIARERRDTLVTLDPEQWSKTMGTSTRHVHVERPKCKSSLVSEGP